jgi:hypothetical protein
MADHKLTGELVLRESFSQADNAIKTIPASNTSFSIELDAADGDNIETRPRGITVVQADGEVACVGMKTICLYGTGTVEVSPTDSGATFVTLTISDLTPITVCARRVKITGTGTLVLQAV